jgi:putative PEP-CTERM system histidine kinase
MTTLPVILACASSALLLVLAVIRLSSRRRNAQSILFALSALIVSAAMLFLALALNAESPRSVMRMLQLHLALMIVSPSLVVPFFLLFGRGGGKEAIRRSIPGIILLVILLAAAALVLPAEIVIERFQIAEGGGLWRIGTTDTGRLLAVLALAVNVLILHIFENTYRAATVPAKVTLKYPLLGVIAASILNFIMATRVILLSETDGYFISLGSLGLIFFGLTILYSGSRYPLFEVRTPRGTAKKSSVVSVVVTGLYLLSLAVITWISNYIGMPYEKFGIMVLLAFAAFIVISVLISGKARRRLRSFINENFRPGLYNYRREWRRYARMTTSSRTLDDLLSNTISSLCDTIMVRKGIIYAGVGGGKSAVYGLNMERNSVEAGWLMELYDGSPVVMVGRHRHHGPRSGDTGREGLHAGEVPDWVRAAAFLKIGGETRGAIALGRKDFGMGWTEEDRDFLATIADQVSLALENLLMEERFLESKQLESFNRFASFVIHDLKNTVGMLSLTAENARDNIHDREFQEDAIDTIERSVEKMRRLIDSLNAHKAPANISRTRTDVFSAAAGKIASLSQLADKRDVTISVASKGDPVAYVDASAVRRIIENLVLNSIEAVPDGGHVEVEMDRSGPVLMITVSDDGPGFDAEYLDEGLFRPFRSTKKNGLGVGLVLCKALAEAHGGSISVVPGRGAVVEVEIPAEG